jgi:outer membrane biosynthesis protein TonB
MKAPDLIQAIQELTAIMSPQTREAYSTHTQHLTKDTMSANRERLAVIHKINYGLITVADAPPEPPKMSTNFFDLFAETASAAPEPEPEPVQESAPEPEPVQESAPEPEPVQETAPEPEPVQETAPEPEPVQETAPEPERDPYEPEWITADLTKLKPEHHAPNMLLVDAIATTGESSHLLDELAPLIREIERQHQRSISLIPYDEGWKILGARLTSWGFRKNIVTIDSSHPLYRHCSHTLLALADIVIKGTR